MAAAALGENLLTPSFLSSTSTVAPAPPPSPYNHAGVLTIELLLRIPSKATDDDIKNVERFVELWHASADVENAITGERGKAKGAAETGLTLQPDHVYHLEFTLPGDGSREKSSGPDICKYFVDILDLQFMAKVFSGRLVDMEIMLTEVFVMRLATHQIDIELYETQEKFCAKAKMDIKTPKKIALPPLSTLSLPSKEDEALLEMHLPLSDYEQWKSYSAAKNLFRAFLNTVPAWARAGISTAFPAVPAPKPQEPTPETPPTAPGKKGQSNKNAKQEDAQKALAAKRKAESIKTPVFKFRALASQLFIRDNRTIIRGIRNPTASDETDSKSELVTSVQDAIMSFGIRDGSLLSTGQKVRLNPVTITIQSVENLPSSPVRFEKLREICSPVHVEFDRFGLEKYKTAPVIQDVNMHWNESVVIFSKPFDPELLAEFMAGHGIVADHDHTWTVLHCDGSASGLEVRCLKCCKRVEQYDAGVAETYNLSQSGYGFRFCGRAGPPLELELHDRDRKDGQCENSFGIAKLDFYPMVCYNLQHMELELAVVPSANERKPWMVKTRTPVALLRPLNSVSAEPKKPDKNLDQKSQASSDKSTTKGKVNATVPAPLPRVAALPAGQYQDFGTVLKVTATSAVPMRDFFDANPRTGSTPFSRCVVVLDIASSPKTMDDLNEFTITFNAKAMDFINSSRTQCAIMNDISTFRLIAENAAPFVAKNPPGEMFDKLDILTGFLLSDGSVQLLVVEGHHEKGMKAFAEFAMAQLADGHGDSKVLWDPSLRFSSRLYGPFGATIFDMSLKTSITELAKDSYLPNAKTLAVEVVHAVRQLDRVINGVKVPRDLAKNQLYPTVAHLRLLQSHLGAI